MQLAKRLDDDPTTCGRKIRRRRRTDTPALELVRVPLGALTEARFARTESVPRTASLRLVGARRLPAIGSLVVEGLGTRWSIHHLPPEIHASDFRVASEARVITPDYDDLDLPLELGRPYLLVPETPEGEAVVTLA